MSDKQANLITLLSTFQELLENTFHRIPPDLVLTLDDLKAYVRDNEPKDH